MVELPGFEPGSRSPFSLLQRLLSIYMLTLYDCQLPAPINMGPYSFVEIISYSLDNVDDDCCRKANKDVGNNRSNDSPSDSLNDTSSFRFQSFIRSVVFQLS